MNLYQKLASVRKLVDIIKKDKDGYKFKYSDINEILAKVKAGMEKYGISLIPAVVPGTYDVVTNTFVTKKADRNGQQYDVSSTEYLFSADMTFTWLNNDNPEEKIVVPWCVVGSQADPSQAYGSGITYCTRYFLLSYFQISQDNDVDKYRTAKREAMEAEDKERVESILTNFDSKIRAFIADNQDRKDDVKKFCMRFAKEGKYMTIKEPLLAAKMLRDFNAEFLGERNFEKEFSEGE